MDALIQDTGDNWVSDLKRRWNQKLAFGDETQSYRSTDNLQALHKAFKLEKHSGQSVDFSPFIFDKQQDVYLQNQKSGMTTNNLKCMVQAFKARIQELNENIDEDFISNIKDKIIPDHEGKMNEFLEEAESYLNDMSDKGRHKTYYLENYIYNKVY